MLKKKILIVRKDNNMKKIDWKNKFTSRKFWAAVVGFITPTMIACGANENQVTQVVAIVMAGATLVAYIIGEGLVDSKRMENTETDLDYLWDNDEDEEFK